jgi:hypothetical protein
VNLKEKDEIIWQKKNLYSVKSVYRVYVDELIDRDSWIVKGHQSKL